VPFDKIDRSYAFQRKRRKFMFSLKEYEEIGADALEFVIMDYCHVSSAVITLEKNKQNLYVSKPRELGTYILLVNSRESNISSSTLGRWGAPSCCWRGFPYYCALSA
jgi:hypothetical protein